MRRLYTTDLSAVLNTGWRGHEPYKQSLDDYVTSEINSSLYIGRPLFVSEDSSFNPVQSDGLYHRRGLLSSMAGWAMLPLIPSSMFV